MDKTEIAKKPIVAIGDIHGNGNWRDIVEAHPDCRIIFLGDYLDPYTYIPHNVLLDNLCDIMDLKKTHPDDIVLLLGNHDMHYFSNYATMGTRIDYEIYSKVSQLFSHNLNLFQYAYQEGNMIFTHAGISQEWWQEDFRGDDTRQIAEQLNNPTEEQMSALCRVGYARGGRYGRHGGIFWADRSELTTPLRGYVQIVGHNRVNEITIYESEDRAKVIFCDCLCYGKYFYINAEG